MSHPWKLDADGRLLSAQQVYSPNCDERPEGSRIELLVIHNISLPRGQFGGPEIIELFSTNITGERVSSHFLIRRDGELIQFVECLKRAWHAGQSMWQGRAGCNDFSVGIELEGSDDSAFTHLQYSVLGKLARTLMAAYPIVECAGHSEIATPSGRKTDPGPFFDWPRFRQLLNGI